MRTEHKSLTARGLHDGSFFEAHIAGQMYTEHNHNWSDMSALIEVTRDGKPYLVHQCTEPISKLRVVHGKMDTTIDVPENCKIYQAVQAVATLEGGKILGRIVGLVKDGVVVEERFLNGESGQVEGTRF